MRSVVVVLPASMCAAMPILRVRSIEYWRFAALIDLALSITACIQTFLFQRIKTPRVMSVRGAWNCGCLPAEMGKGLVGLGHLVHFIALANRVSLALKGFQNFRGQRVFHGNALA